jgi:hypothetical protein
MAYGHAERNLALLRQLEAELLDVLSCVIPAARISPAMMVRLTSR